MYSYTAYGLRIGSSIALPELVPAAFGDRDVTVRIGSVGRSPHEIRSVGRNYRIEPNVAYLHWEKLGSYRVTDGCDITIEPAVGVEERSLRLPLLGTVLALLLHQRGLLVLHASSAAVRQQVVVFLGEKGWGKSTMAAALCARGHTLVADDLVALAAPRPGEEDALALPGFPRLKLCPDAAEAALGDDPEALPPVIPGGLVPGYDKRDRRVSDRFATEALPIRRIYVLGAGETPEIEPLSPQSAVLQLIRHSYVARFRQDLLHGVPAGSHLATCSRLTTQVRVSTLKRPLALHGLGELARMVERDLNPQEPLAILRRSEGECLEELPDEVGVLPSMAGGRS